MQILKTKMWKYMAGSVVIGSLTAYSIRRYHAGTFCNCPGRLDGSVVVITGANSGIGRALSHLLAQRGATLVLACRDVQKGIDTKTDIESKLNTEGDKIYVKELDLASLASVRKFAKSLNSEFPEITALVNNAGVFYFPLCDTVDGLDVTLQTNYFGPFVLTHLLLRLLKKSRQGRIVNVSSEAIHLVKDENYLFETTEYYTSKFYKFILYGVSKLALHVMTLRLAKDLADSNILVNSANPGNVETAIYRHYPFLSNRFLFALQWPIRKLIIKRPEEGAQTIMHALLTTDKATGQYLSECKVAETKPVTESTVNEYYRRTMEFCKWYIDDDLYSKLKSDVA